MLLGDEGMLWTVWTVSIFTDNDSEFTSMRAADAAGCRRVDGRIDHVAEYGTGAHC